MVTNLRVLTESHLSVTLEGAFSLPVILIAPDGVTLPEVRGQINYETVIINPDTGEEIAINTPNVSLRRSSLTRIPEAGEKWVVKIPVSPEENAPVESFIISPTQPPQGGRSIGFIRLYLNRIEQS